MYSIDQGAGWDNRQSAEGFTDSETILSDTTPIDDVFIHFKSQDV